MIGKSDGTAQSNKCPETSIDADKKGMFGPFLSWLFGVPYLMYLARIASLFSVSVSAMSCLNVKKQIQAFLLSY